MSETIVIRPLKDGSSLIANVTESGLVEIMESAEVRDHNGAFVRNRCDIVNLGPKDMELLVAKWIEKKSSDDDGMVTKVQKIVKDYADAHPGEITLPCEKHQRLPCVECGVGIKKKGAKEAQESD